MGHDQSFWPKFVQVSHQGLKIHVKLDLLLEKIGLCNQEIGSLSCWQEGFCPFRIASIGDNFPVALHSQGQGRISSGMLNAVSGDDHAIEGLWLIECELSYVQ